MRAHPWHPALVHFPIACWVLATLVDIITQFLALPPLPGIAWVSLAHVLIWIGVVLALPAMMAGVVDYLGLPDAVQVGAAALRHITAMVTAWLLFLGAALWRAHLAHFDSAPSWGMTFLELAGVACLLVGGRYAAELVFVHMAGARSQN